MYVQRVGSAREHVLHLITQALEDFVVLAGDADFDGRFLDRPLLQFPKKHTRFGRGLREFGAQRLHQPRRGFRRRRRDQQLRVILVRQLWIHVVVEARSAGSHERGVVDDLLFVPQHLFDAPHRGIRRFHLPSFGKPNVGHELVALREWEETLRNMLQRQSASDHGKNARGESNWFPSHSQDNHAVVDHLQEFER